jgi:hypothetical protein
MKPADLIEVPIIVIIDMLESGEIEYSELTDEQKEQVPNKTRKLLGI